MILVDASLVHVHNTKTIKLYQNQTKECKVVFKKRPLMDYLDSLFMDTRYLFIYFRINIGILTH
jgi:hypothetical protein